MTTGVPGEPSSITSTRTPSGTSTTTMVTLPPGAPDRVCRIALVTSSDVSKVAASGSAAAPSSPGGRIPVMNARAAATSSGRPGIVSEPKIEVRCLLPAPEPLPARLFRGVSIRLSLPSRRQPAPREPPGHRQASRHRSAG